MSTVSILNYGLGNISALCNLYKNLNISCSIINSPKDIETAQRIILPGVGSFDWAMSKLQDSNFISELNSFVLVKSRPILGICVGLQMLGNKSEEGNLPGLGWLDFDVVKFNFNDIKSDFRLPHMGWNDVEPLNSSILFDDLSNPIFYFLHSFHVTTNDNVIKSSITNYGKPFISSVTKDNIYGVQFHPEKSHNWGTKLLFNFANKT